CQKREAEKPANNAIDAPVRIAIANTSACAATWNQGAQQWNTSSAVMSQAASRRCEAASNMPCGITTPFETPVVPELNMMVATSPAWAGAGTSTDEALASETGGAETPSLSPIVSTCLGSLASVRSSASCSRGTPVASAQNTEARDLFTTSARTRPR